MYFTRMTSAADEMHEKAMELYRESFPDFEQREAECQRLIMDNPDYHFDLIYDEERFCGMILYWERDHFLYVEHFCITPEMRNRRCGQRALALLCQKDKTVILEIDPPEDTISMRRRGFYERAGFQTNSFAHVHPPYHKENQGHRLVVMSYPQQISSTIYGEFNEYLKNVVMEYLY